MKKFKKINKMLQNYFQYSKNEPVHQKITEYHDKQIQSEQMKYRISDCKCKFISR